MFILICLYWPCKAPLGEWLVNIIVVIFIIIIVIITIIISSSSSIIIVPSLRKWGLDTQLLFEKWAQNLSLKE